MAFQSQTFANSGYAYYGNPADWSKFPTLNSTISFNGTNATLKVIPAVPDSNTTIEFNGNQLAYAGESGNVADWAQYVANHNVDINSPYVLNANVANISTLNVVTQSTENIVNVSSFIASTFTSVTANISSLTASTLTAVNLTSPKANFTSTIIAPNLTVSTLKGPSINVIADEGLITTQPSAIDLNTVNGSYGKISLTANPGQLATLGGQINVTANGGNSVGGLYGAVNIVANAGKDVTTDIFTGGKINITANSETALGSLTSALNLNSGGINSYAGFGTPIASLFGYNFINGTAGVSLCASVVPNSAFQVPGTCYLYGDTGITLGSDTYVTNLFPYWNGLAPPPNLKIAGRTTVSGTAQVTLENVSSINGVVYPPPSAVGVTSLNTLSGALALTSTDNTISINPSSPNINLATTRTPQLSTITMNPDTGVIRTNDIQNPNTNSNDFGISQENALGNLSLTVSPLSGPTVGDITINNNGTLSFNQITSGTGIQITPEGNTLTFLQSVVPANQGQIVGLSTINGVPFGNNTSINGLSGAVTLAPGTNTSIVSGGGNTITIGQTNIPLVNRSSGNTPLLITAITQATAQTIGSVTVSPTFVSDIQISGTFTAQSNTNTKTDIFFLLTIDNVIVGFVFQNTVSGINHYGNCSIQGTALAVTVGAKVLAIKAYASTASVFTIAPFQISAIANLA